MEEQIHKDPNEWPMTTRYVVGIGLFLFLLVLLYISRSVLSSLVVAALIAFLVRPAIEHMNTRWRVPRALATLIMYVITLLVIVITPLLLIPPIVSAANAILAYDYPSITADSLTWLEGVLVGIQLSQTGWPQIDEYIGSIVTPLLANLQQTEPITIPSLPAPGEILAILGGAVTSGVSVAVSVVGAFVSFAISLFFILAFSIYMVNDTGNFRKFFMGLVPTSHAVEIDQLFRRVTATMSAWLRGQLVLMVFIGVVIWIGNLILGLPGAFLLGVIAGIFELIPNLGPFLALIPALLVALTQGSTYLPINNFIFALIVLGFYLLAQQVESTYIVPRVMGRELRLHPLVILVGVLVGAAQFGILGALLAAPVIAMGQLVLGYLYRKVVGINPDVAEPEQKPSGTIRESTHRVTRWVQRSIPRRSQPTEVGQESDPIIDDPGA